jgi:membrane protein DedA with SNARE-associated domain/membrane-associated phospholipid phosphatase
VKPLPLLAAVALAVFLVVRRRKLEPTLLIGGGIVVALLLVYGSGAVHLPNVKNLVEDLGGALGQWTYLLVGIAAFLETGAFVGLLAPGETFLIFGGVVAGQGKISLVALIAIVWTCAVMGDLASFYAGRRLGRSFLVKHGPKVSITEERLHHVEAFFDRHGGKAILLGRFVGVVRAVNPFLAGSSGMPLRRFLPYDVIGAGAWATILLLLGYTFWHSFDRVLHYAEQGTLALATVIVVGTLIVYLVRRFRDEERRAQTMRWIDVQLERPALRPLARVLPPLWRRARPPLRFVWNRITPGALGLEFTTLGASLAVGTFVFTAYAMTLADVALTTGDERTMIWAHELYDPTVADIAKVVTELGSLPVVSAAVGVAAVGLAMRHRVFEAATLVTGLALTFVAVHVAKEAIGRPRPPDPLQATSGLSYPSGHSAYAITWVAIALVVTRTAPGLTRTTVAVVSAIAIAVVVGITRIYLRAHYLSDVLGGYGLAAAIFSLCGMAALVVAHVRHNAVRA